MQRFVDVNFDFSHHVAEMEERLHQMETDRLQEHGAAELELDERHKMLQRLQHEAEMMKAEAQQVSAQGHRGEIEGHRGEVECHRGEVEGQRLRLPEIIFLY